MRAEAAALAAESSGTEAPADRGADDAATDGAEPKKTKPRLLRIDTVVEVPPEALRIRNQFVDVFVDGTLDVSLVGSAIEVAGSVAIDGSVSLYGRTLTISPDSRVILRPS